MYTLKAYDVGNRSDQEYVLIMNFLSPLFATFPFFSPQ